MADYNYSDIVDVFRSLGLKRGDCVFTHSNLGFYGRCNGVKTSKNLCEYFKKAFFEVIGDEGTIIVPTFTYSFCHKEKYDPKNTTSNMGMFSEYIRCLPEAIRSLDANFSVSALGKLADFLTKNPPEHSFGKDSFWDKFKNVDGKIVNLNFDSASTYIHYVERELKVPYRWDKQFNGTLIVDGKEKPARFYHFVWDPKIPEHCPNFELFDKIAKQRGLAMQKYLGKGSVVTISAKDTYELIKGEIQNNISFLLKGSYQAVASN